MNLQTIKKLILMLTGLLLLMNCQTNEKTSNPEKPVVFYRDGKQIVGMMHRPTQPAAKYPAVVLLHGFTGNKSESHWLFTKLSRELAKSGIMSLRFDFLGSGDSQGEFQDMTILTELEDAKAALKFLKSQPDVNTEKIGIIGLSMGGCVAALLAGENNEISSLVLLSAVSQPEKNFSQLPEYLPKVKLDENNWYLDNNGFAIGKNFIEVLPDIHPLTTIGSFAGDLLIIHGTDDQAVPVSAAHDYFETMHNRLNAETELFLVEKGDHVYTSLEKTNTVISKISEWFQRTLKAEK